MQFFWLIVSWSEICQIQSGDLILQVQIAALSIVKSTEKVELIFYEEHWTAPTWQDIGRFWQGELMEYDSLVPRVEICLFVANEYKVGQFFVVWFLEHFMEIVLNMIKVLRPVE